MRLEGALLGLLSFLTTFIGHNGVYMRHQKEKNLKKIKKWRWEGEFQRSRIGEQAIVINRRGNFSEFFRHSRRTLQYSDTVVIGGNKKKKLDLRRWSFKKKKAEEDRALQFLRLSKFHPLKRSRGKKQWRRATKPHLLTPSLATLSSILFYHFLSFWLQPVNWNGFQTRINVIQSISYNPIASRINTNFPRQGTNLI